MAKSFKPLLFGRCAYCKKNVYGNSQYDVINFKLYHKKCAKKIEERTNERNG